MVLYLDNVSEKAINTSRSSQIQIKEQHETVKIENEKNVFTNIQILILNRTDQCMNTRKNLLVLWCTNINKVEVFHPLHDNGCTTKQADILSMEQEINWKQFLERFGPHMCKPFVYQNTTVW